MTEIIVDAVDIHDDQYITTTLNLASYKMCQAKL